jgi:hypothetical protein
MECAEEQHRFFSLLCVSGLTEEVVLGVSGMRDREIKCKK